MQMLYIWILAAVVFGVLEGITAQLVSIWFVLGAVAAAVAAACGGAVWPRGCCLWRCPWWHCWPPNRW